ncbi:MAG TPA: PAS domain S-box protein, partial [Firmicutes bacterium]|nr:PAS domain S-box protein [Bacillota bacterium]
MADKHTRKIKNKMPYKKTKTRDKKTAKVLSASRQKRIKMLEQGLLNSEEMNKKLLIASSDAIVTISSGGIIIHASEHAADMFSVDDVEELFGRRIYDFTAARDKQKLLEGIKRCFVEGYVRGMEITFMGNSGRDVDSNVNCVKLATASASPDAAMLAIRDISARKRMEKHLI